MIDKAAVKFGMPMGPIELIDTVGLDVAAGVGELAPFLGLQIPTALQTVEPDKRGKKDGQGIYTWENGKPKKPDVASDYQAPVGLEDRLILPLLNEAVACLHEGVVADADLLDAGVIFGTGFAPFRGGPIQHIRAVGADAIVERLKALQQRHGDRFARARAGTTPPCANQWFELISRACGPAPAEATAEAKPEPEPEQQPALALFVGRGGVGVRGRRKPVLGAWPRHPCRGHPHPDTAP